MTAQAGRKFGRGADALVIWPQSEMLVAMADQKADRRIDALMTPNLMKVLLANLVMS